MQNVIFFLTAILKFESLSSNVPSFISSSWENTLYLTWLLHIQADLTRNWYEPRVESLEVTKMCFPKINHELPLINIDSFEKEEKEQEREKKSW